MDREERALAHLAFIRMYTAGAGFSPSISELAREVGVSVRTIKLDLDWMRERGWIERPPRRHRAITVTDTAPPDP